ncbi:MAG: hypothetical protein PVG03_01925 [Desulfarculaceae bacterium]
MLPFIFEWQWDLGHIIFFGLFFAALTIVVFTLARTFFVTMADCFFGPPKNQSHDEHH